MASEVGPKMDREEFNSELQMTWATEVTQHDLEATCREFEMQLGEAKA
jgi:BMFP domain-containing protein YqiC